MRPPGVGFIQIARGITRSVTAPANLPKILQKLLAFRVDEHIGRSGSALQHIVHGVHSIPHRGIGRILPHRDAVSPILFEHFLNHLVVGAQGLCAAAVAARVTINRQRNESSAMELGGSMHEFGHSGLGVAVVQNNLIQNAQDAMPGGGKVFVRFLTEKNELITEIEDTGSGIAPEIAHTLFEAFATFGKEHGTGLGLSICKKIIEDHAGRIWARNEPGRGAVFAFSLPTSNS